MQRLAKYSQKRVQELLHDLEIHERFWYLIALLSLQGETKSEVYGQ